jgi:pimeloyl-ACP methyl ester carboxylesterase
MSSRLPKRTPRPRRLARRPDRRLEASTATSTTAWTSSWLGDDRLFMPLGHEPGYDYPLLVWLPDAGWAAGTGRPFDLGRAMTRVSLRNHVAVQPVAAEGEDLEDAVWRSIERVCDRVAIHRGRVFLVGQAAGGTEAFRIACRHPREFAGVASLGGPFPLDEGLFAQLAEVRRLPMLLCCQRAGVVAEAARTDRMLRLFHAAGAALAMRIYPGRDDLSRAALADVNRWVMDEVCGTPAAVHSLSAS